MMRSLRRSIRTKLVIVVLVTTFAALLVTAVVLVMYEIRTYRQSGVEDLIGQADLLGSASAAALSFDDPLAAQQDLALLKVRPGIEAAGIYTLAGNLFATYRRPGFEQFAFPKVPLGDSYRVAGDQVVVFRRIHYAGETVGTVFLVAHYELEERLKGYFAIVGMVMGVSLFVTGMLSFWLQSSVTRPILEVGDVARRVRRERDFSLRARRTTDDEIGALVDAFNDMLGEIGSRAEALERSNRELGREMAVRAEAEQRLRATDRSKDEFLATLAHELRNPLAPLRNALEILRMRGNDPAIAAHARQIMERQLAQMVRLVDDLLDVSRITTGKLTLRTESVALAAIVQSAVDAAAPTIEARGVTLTVSLPERPVNLTADPTRLAQVLFNLLHNAAKFTEPGGRIHLAAERGEGQVVITLSDTGIGIPPERLTSIFDMFAQLESSLDRTHGGLGVGLSLAKRLVELHGGTLAAHSEGVGRGSRFVVQLPVATLAPLPSAPRGDGPPAEAGALRVLLADDNQDFVETFATLLRVSGHQVGCAHDGAQALELAKQFAPDVGFIDIGLPEMNGYEVARRLRAHSETRAMMLVAVTGWGQARDRQLALEAGFDHHVVKPMDPEEFRRILRRAAAGERAADAS